MLDSSTVVEWWVLSTIATVRGSTALDTSRSCSCRRLVVWTQLSHENHRRRQSTNLVSASWTPSCSNRIPETNHLSARSRLGYTTMHGHIATTAVHIHPGARIANKLAQFAGFSALCTNNAVEYAIYQNEKLKISGPHSPWRGSVLYECSL